MKWRYALLASAILLLTLLTGLVLRNLPIATDPSIYSGQDSKQVFAPEETTEGKALGVEQERKQTLYTYWLIICLVGIALNAALLTLLICIAHIKQRKKEQLLHERERCWALMLDSADLGAWNWDVTTDMTVTNKRWATMLGYTEDELPLSLSDFWIDHIHPDDRSRVSEALRQHQEGETDHYEAEYRMQTKRGDWLWILARARAVARDDRGQALRIAGTHLDITARKQIERQLNVAKEAAESANHAKSQFLAVMSHEIRTPLNGVLGLVELLQHSRLDKQQQRHIEMLTSSAQALAHLIDEVLDLAKIEAGKLVLEPAEFNPQALVTDLQYVFAERVRAKGLALLTYLSDDVPEQVCGDAKRLRQVLNNLIGNAINHTVRGTVTVNISVAELSKAKACLRFEVADTGVGIAREQQSSIFGAFVQADSSTRRRRDGAGLGLTVCQQLLNLMGSKLQLDSTSEQGSKFYFTVCMQRVSNKQSQSTDAVSGQSEMATGVKPKVLIAEDNPVNQELVGQMMILLGCEVACVENGQAALESVMQQGYDLILMDLRMPKMDGFDATIAIRQREQSGPEHIPIIALTADVVAGMSERCREVGMDGFLSKPVALKQLREMLIHWVPGYTG